MKASFFTKPEAESKVGQRIESIAALPSAPVGTIGTVVGVRDRGSDEWALNVAWTRPKSGGEFFAMLGEFSFNVSRRARTAMAELSKDEFATAVRPIKRSV